MRLYAKVAPQFWIGKTGKLIRGLGGVEAQLVGLYLLTSPHANMIGLYHLPVAYIAADTGLSIEGATKALRSTIEGGFCDYDDDAEVVWVFEMARYQIGDRLKPTDKQCKGINTVYLEVPENRFLADFFKRYSTAFHLTQVRETNFTSTKSEMIKSPIEAPPKELRCQEQDQDEQDQDEKTLAPFGAVTVRPENFIASWNRLSGPLPKVRELTDSRRRKIKTRIAQNLTLERFEEAINRCVVTPFLVGSTGRSDWRADFDWLIENDTNMAKVLEGKYDSAPARVVRDVPLPLTAEQSEAVRARKEADERESYAIWMGMSEAYRAENPWTGRVFPAEEAQAVA